MKVYEGKRMCPTGKHPIRICRMTLHDPFRIDYLCLTCDATWSAPTVPVIADLVREREAGTLLAAG